MIEKKQYADFSRPLHGKAFNVGRITDAQIELTYACNLKCVHCYTDCYNQPDLIRNREMSLEMVTRILDELAEMGVLWVTFTGGEVFMRRDFREIYLYARKKGFLITLFTNVTTVTKEIADFLAENPPFAVETSCHGLSETFDRVTQVPGSFRRFEEGLKLLLERKLKVKVKGNAMTLNRGRLQEIRAFVEGLGLPFQLSMEIYPRLNGDLEPCAYRLSPQEAVALLARDGGVVDKDDRCRKGREASEPIPPEDDRLYRCGCGTTHLQINAWGELSTCTFVGEPRADLRKMSVAEAVAELFPKVRGARYESASICRTCEVHLFCDKMPSIAWAETGGDREAPVGHFCDVAYLKAGYEPREKGEKYG